jgi:xanthine dehydrogenase accessory factor
MGVDPRQAIEAFEHSAQGSEPYALATVVRTEKSTSAQPGAKVIITPQGDLIGWVGSTCVQGAVRRIGQEVLKTGTAKLIRVKPKEDITGSHDEDGVELHKSGCPSKGTSDIFVEPVLPRPQIVICGNSYVAQSLAGFAAASGYAILQAAPGLDPAASQTHGGILDDFDFSHAKRLDQSYWVVATQGARDHDGLKAALAQDAPYIAFVGSRRKINKLKETMRAEGVPQARLNQVHCPAGLNLGAIEPAEIAVSILAQIIQTRRTQDAQAAPVDDKKKAKSA